uniref:Uncharacterized protein n=1 Tax=Arundo donax TaxID=35708 RepID=A0A0A9BVP9_ARUDO
MLLSCIGNWMDHGCCSRMYARNSEFSKPCSPARRRKGSGECKAVPSLNRRHAQPCHDDT